MADRLEYSTGRVLAFVNSISQVPAVAGMWGIGLERDGELRAGVLFEGFNGRSIWMHVAAIPGGHWLTRRCLRAAFTYPFVQCGVDRIFAFVNASNYDARRFDEHLGFEQEAVLRGAAPDGGDAIIYVMPRARCKYV